ncbi:cell division protein FtsX, partial [endosymbiont of Lamellibrachia barhami]|uniref:cell division protein FtsX n=1 Tax=endosymbiont of Lamellibrachia barhami TaxID=205975 RepID=UPI0034E29079
QLDLQWVRRLQAITEIAQRAVLVLATLLGLAVLLIIGNTIRLEIQNRHAEIEITKLIGATNGFIRRPFLYTGLWYGLFGGIIAWLLVAISILLISGPVAQLAMLYQSAFDLSSLDITTTLLLLSGSAGLGLLGSWIAVGRHLSEIEPS